MRKNKTGRLAQKKKTHDPSQGASAERTGTLQFPEAAVQLPPVGGNVWGSRAPVCDARFKKIKKNERRGEERILSSTLVFQKSE